MHPRGHRQHEHRRRLPLRGGEVQQLRLRRRVPGEVVAQREDAVLLVLIGEQRVLHEEQPQAERDEVPDPAGRGVEPPTADRAGQHDRRPEVEQPVTGAPAGDVQAVDPVVDDVDRDGDQEGADPPLHQPQGAPVDAVAGVAVDQDEPDHERRARGVEQVRGREVVAEPAEVPRHVPRRAEHLEQEGAQPRAVDPGQLGLVGRAAGAPGSQVGRPEPADQRDRVGERDAHRSRRRRNRRGGGSGCSRERHDGTSSARRTSSDPIRDRTRNRPVRLAATPRMRYAATRGACGAGGAYCRVTWQTAQGTWSGSIAR